MKLTIYTANCCGVESNTRYPNKTEITSPKELVSAVSHDQVFASYKNNVRSNENFLESSVIPMDVDNKTNNPMEWVTKEMVQALFHDVSFVLFPSRHNMKEKEGFIPAPRFHILFPVHSYSARSQYRDLKIIIQKAYPFFDGSALGEARFFYGYPVKESEVIWHEGSKMIDDLPLKQCPQIDEETGEVLDDFANMPERHSGGVIPQGERNSTLSHRAGKILKKYGHTDQAKQAFLEAASQCDPPLEKSELKIIWNSAVRFFNKKVKNDPNYIDPSVYNNDFQKESVQPEQSSKKWEPVVPFSKGTRPPFPIEALPHPYDDYVKAVAASTQTAVDMAGTAVLGVLATCMQKQFVVQGKEDWIEPTNLYLVIVAESSERKSTVLRNMVKPLDTFEKKYNEEHAAEREGSESDLRIMQRKQKELEDQIAKPNKKDDVNQLKEELDKVNQSLANFKVKKKLRLYADDITPEKLANTLVKNDSHAALISSEGGIFNNFNGQYNKNASIDNLLKAYSGDSIRVERLGRDEDYVYDPALTILVMAQDQVIHEVLKNDKFVKRGLTARFLYCLPVSKVGDRGFESKPVDISLYGNYEAAIVSILQETDSHKGKPEVITLSPEARKMLADYSDKLEPRLVGDLRDMSAWAGKLVGTVLRLSGILCRAGTMRVSGFLQDDPAPLVVSESVMVDAIKLGDYYLQHAMAAFDLLPVKEMQEDAEKVLGIIRRFDLHKFSRRTIMQKYRKFKDVKEVQEVLDFLENYGYIDRIIDEGARVRRDSQPKYITNPVVFENEV